MVLKRVLSESSVNEWRDWSDDWPVSHGWTDTEWASDNWDDSHH